MLVNTALAEMGIDDLNQRYSQTYIQYDGKVVFVLEFIPATGIDIVYQTVSKTIQEPFKPLAVNVERPEPGWVVEDSCPYYIYYLNNRQWRRGICHDNTRAYSPFAVDPIAIRLWTKAYEPRSKDKLRMTMGELNDTIQKKHFVILQPHLAAIRRDTTHIDFYFRTHVIANWSLKSGLTMLQPLYEEELRESVIGLTSIINKTTSRPKMEYSTKVGLSVGTTWNKPKRNSTMEAFVQDLQRQADGQIEIDMLVQPGIAR